MLSSIDRTSGAIVFRTHTHKYMDQSKLIWFAQGHRKPPMGLASGSCAATCAVMGAGLEVYGSM